MSELLKAISSRTALAPPGLRLYAIGDIHGRRDLLDGLLASILRDSQRSRAGRRLVVFLGDYIDRGPHSCEVIETLRRGPPATPAWSGFRWVCLRGNHEESMLSFLDDIAIGPMWLANGGAATIQSYAGDIGADLRDLEDLQAALRSTIPPSHLDFLGSLPVSHVEGDYFFTHAGVRPGVPLERQEPSDLLWIRNAFLTSSADHGKLVVHGHSISKAPDVRRNRIGVDTGAYHSGRLTALVAEGAERSFLST